MQWCGVRDSRAALRASLMASLRSASECPLGTRALAGSNPRKEHKQESLPSLGGFVFKWCGVRDSPRCAWRIAYGLASLGP